MGHGSFHLSHKTLSNNGEKKFRRFFVSDYLNPFYTKLFRTHTLYHGGGGVIWSRTISSTLDRTNLKFCKVLDIPFKISENTRFVKNLLYGYHGNYLITWCFLLIIVKTSMKNRYFSNAPRNHKLEGIKMKLFEMIVLFMYVLKE